MTIETQTLALCARYERTILQAQSPVEVVELRRDLGEAIELLRSIGQIAIRKEQALSGGCDDATFQHALKTAGHPSAAWPPKLRMIKIERGERL